MTAAKQKGLALIAEIDEAELALRLAEIGIGIRRQHDGSDARFLLRELEHRWPKEGGPFPFRTMARCAIEYLGECIKNSKVPS